MMWYGLDGQTDMWGLGDDCFGGEPGLVLDLGGRELILPGSAGGSVTLASDGGMSIYADLDGDGRIDHISSVHASGGFDVWTTDEWGTGGVEDWGLTPEVGHENRPDGGSLSEWYHIDGGENPPDLGGNGREPRM